MTRKIANILLTIDHNHELWASKVLPTLSLIIFFKKVWFSKYLPKGNEIDQKSLLIVQTDTSTHFQQLTILSFLSVLVVAVVYRRVRIRQETCDQFSDVTSTSSRSSASTCSTISSTRSTKSVPDRMNIISFNAEGNLRKQVCYYNWFNWPGAVRSCFRPTTVTTSTVWIVTTSWAVWRIFQYKCESY